MKNLFNSYGITVDDEKISKLQAFGEILREYSAVMSLTTITEGREMWIKHFLDSLLGINLFKKGASVCEIGSGGGFPSIPLKILRDDLSFTLVESTGKKCNYLNSVVKELKLSNVTVICSRAEDLAKNPLFREKFDHSTARAVARLNTLCEYCMPFVKKGGSFIAYKGSDVSEAQEASNAVKILGGKISSVNNFTLPDGAGERNIIVIDKISATPSKYPRGNGKERKDPL